jgi:hypothetical protein
MALIKLKNFISEQESAQEKGKELQIKTTAEKEMLEINKRISEIDLAIANLIKREQDGTLIKSDSINQQALELQKKVAEMQKKSVAQKKIESLEK